MTFSMDNTLIHLERLMGSLELGVIVSDGNLEPPGPTILYVNSAMLKLTGYSASELIGANPRLLQGAKTNRDVLNQIRTNLQQEQSCQGETYNYRKDGSEYIVEWHISPIRGNSETVEGWLAIQRDVTRHRLDRAARVESERRFEQFGRASSDALWIRNAEALRVEYASQAFSTIFGQSRADTTEGSFEHWLELVVPDDRHVVIESLQRVTRGEQVEFEYRVHRLLDDELRWILSTAFPLLDETGQVQRVGGIARDVTQVRRNAERLRELIAELQHRTRNLLAVIGAMADKTLRAASSLDDFRGSFLGRLAALARVQGLLSRLEEHDRITFDELIRAELLGCGAMNGATDRVALHGPSGVYLRSSMVQTLAMALHELATNALKYGALNQPEGYLDVGWQLIEEAGRQPRLRIDWQESGVVMPAASATSQKAGQGRRLIERALPYAMDASTSFELGPDGVRCSIIIPVSEKTRIAEAPADEAGAAQVE